MGTLRRWVVLAVTWIILTVPVVTSVAPTSVAPTVQAISPDDGVSAGQSVGGPSHPGLDPVLIELLQDTGLKEGQAFLRAAHRVLEHRWGSPGVDLDGGLEAAVDQQRTNIQAARQLIALGEVDHATDLHRAIALAQAGTHLTGMTLGSGQPEPIPLAGYELPSRALMALSARHGVDLHPDQLDGMHRLDAHPGPVRGALARVVDAFIALEAAAGISYEGTDPGVLEDQAAYQARGTQAPADRIIGATPGGAMVQAGIDPGLLLATRGQFLEAILDLQAALSVHPAAPQASCAPDQVSFVYSIDMTRCDNTYPKDFLLLIDAGGSDFYRNNAGGTGVGPRPDGATGCNLIDASISVTAALADLGPENDTYGDPTILRGCGMAGGAVLGVGLLVDEGGNETYTAGGSGVNGGGHIGGVGALIDGEGNDTYTAGGGGANGGAIIASAGLLVDGGGNDTYTALDGGTNGGGTVGVGVLLDHDGNDVFTADLNGANGGGWAGVGFLFDGAGHDRHVATDRGTNGGGYLAGVGSLIDPEGDDVREAGSRGTNGGGSRTGAGLLLDGTGDDVYRAGSCGVNGGGEPFTCPSPLIYPFEVDPGLLLDHRGWDEYDDGDIGRCWDCVVLGKGLAGTQLDGDPILDFSRIQIGT